MRPNRQNTESRQVDINIDGSQKVLRFGKPYSTDILLEDLTFLHCIRSSNQWFPEDREKLDRIIARMHKDLDEALSKLDDGS
jgi:hypothetical protein